MSSVHGMHPTWLYKRPLNDNYATKCFMNMNLVSIKNRRLYIFTDGSVNTRSKVGYGAYLVISDLETPVGSLKDSVNVKRFEQTSSTKLELQVLLWSLSKTHALFVRFNFRRQCKIVCRQTN